MSYYESKDLGRFAEVGKFKPDLMNKFFDYYNEATGTDGALTKREKALIALSSTHIFGRSVRRFFAHQDHCKVLRLLFGARVPVVPAGEKKVHPTPACTFNPWLWLKAIMIKSPMTTSRPNCVFNFITSPLERCTS